LPANVQIRWQAFPFGSVEIENPNRPTTRIRAISGGNVSFSVDVQGECGFLPIISKRYDY
jgi:hypothetical protein